LGNTKSREVHFISLSMNRLKVVLANRLLEGLAWLVRLKVRRLRLKVTGSPNPPLGKTGSGIVPHPALTPKINWTLLFNVSYIDLFGLTLQV